MSVRVGGEGVLVGKAHPSYTCCAAVCRPRVCACLCVWGGGAGECACTVAMAGPRRVTLRPFVFSPTPLCPAPSPHSPPRISPSPHAIVAIHTFLWCAPDGYIVLALCLPILQRFLNVPPDMGLEQAVLTSAAGAAANSTGNVVMYPDVYGAVEELIFRGVEVDLIVFEMLVCVFGLCAYLCLAGLYGGVCPCRYLRLM
jgi:hypothetical protein